MTSITQIRRTKNISMLMLFAFVFTTTYALNEVSATTPDYHGHKWYWEETDYRYGSMGNFNGLTQSEAYAAIDSARSEISSMSDYHADKVTTGGNWITETYWSDETIYGYQQPHHDWLNYLDGSDIELNNNPSIDWVDGTSQSGINFRAVVTHELSHGVDFLDTETSGTVAFHSYYYSEWTEFQTDDDAKMVDIYG